MSIWLLCVIIIIVGDLFIYKPLKIILIPIIGIQLIYTRKVLIKSFPLIKLRIQK